MSVTVNSGLLARKTVVPSNRLPVRGLETIGMKVLWEYLAVGSAGALGAVSRLAVARLCALAFGTAFPAGTFIINITGSLFLGWFATYMGQRTGASETLRLAVAVGFVGAYTTFSTYMYESNTLLEGGKPLTAWVNLLGSLLVGLIAVRVGIWLAKA